MSAAFALASGCAPLMTALAWWVVAMVLEWGPPPKLAGSWHEVRYRGRTQYVVERDSLGPFVHAIAVGQNSALLRRVAPQPTLGRLEWRWRVRRHPQGADPSQRPLDDRAAAVLVLVKRSLLPWRTRGLLYQWSAARPAGEWARSPYARDIHVLTLTDAPAGAGWRRERRDLRADLRQAFGESDVPIEAIGVLCDADNTRDRAEADFGEIAWLPVGDDRDSVASDSR